MRHYWLKKIDSTRIAPPPHSKWETTFSWVWCDGIGFFHPIEEDWYVNDNRTYAVLLEQRSRGGPRRFA